ncbi:MAG: ADP-ribose pyrophosphatase [Candidatus Woesebacteria bacterium GW2011_GWC2_47_16]|uniref:ADP-ribose pyrophosphatase n=7 Tax=Candidatus Woeseibacteriota TaxID=1752722 RepID=A0A0G1SND2_9BACT|nr:MAG: ADP-ribose pyrophosphatase [Candidatus Woesebacteria bacterium GW2011_GWE1_45_18]KKU25165.1 MAG: ADP-ribose pyrophosphatase [Candidatus Woesebacteria bacterium GW2011_GWF1_46_13]KKU65362.1 MAG: ADP-ribose pyrophosphatase [Candidatus Woesebacteria bacterium GW2011_GWC2_47_16]KKU70972.1 MAG: ADP-ribose pyrophosphatase [Candidatus Woesebacteria bacterium GW2011_GWD1_47_21]
MQSEYNLAMKKNYIKWIRSKVGHAPIFGNHAAAVIFDNKGRILLQKRRDNKKWGLLGGHIEIGETFRETVVREVEEESGLIVGPGKLLGIYLIPPNRLFYPNGDVVVPIGVVFYCRVLKKDKSIGKSSKETLELRYFAENELPEIWNPQTEKIIKDAFKKKEAVCY